MQSRPPRPLSLRRCRVHAAAAALLAAIPGCGNGMVAVGADGRPQDDSPGQRAHTFYVDPAGSDAETGTRARPWRSIARGLLALAPGDTMVLRGGTYFETGLRVTRSGTPGAPITIRGEAGEQAVIDGGLRAFRGAPNADWEPVDPSRDHWRSRSEFPDMQAAFGYLSEADGGYRLVPYEDLDALAAENEFYDDAEPYYVGPGLMWSAIDRRVHVRLSHSRYQGSMDLRTPGTTDPCAVSLLVFSPRSVLGFHDAAHVVVENLRIVHGDQTVHIDGGSHDLVVRDCSVRGGRYEFVVRDGARRLTFERVVVDGGFPPWVARSDVKRPATGAPAHQLQGAAMELEGAVEDVRVVDCAFRGLFDGIDAIDRPTRFEVLGCEFRTIRDDAMELSTAGHHVEFAHNRLVAVTAGLSWRGGGAAPAAAAGTKYVHHNVIDTSERQLYGRDDPSGALNPAWRGPAGDGMASGPPFGLHDSALLTGPDPWRIYQNTLVVDADVDGWGTGAGYRFPWVATGTPHEVVNNIFIVRGDQSPLRGARVDDRSQVFDGNLYWRQPSATSPLLSQLIDGPNTADFFSRSQFRTSPFCTATQTYYAAGWEASGVEGDPDLDGDYRPSPVGPAATGAVDLGARGWPGAATTSWRGALPPR